MTSPSSAQPTRGLLRGPALVLLLAGVVAAGCTRYVSVDRDRGPQAYYQTAFPVEDVSEQLETTLASVVRIHVEGAYDRYEFSEEDAPLVSQAEGVLANLLALAVDTVPTSTTRAATAVVIAVSDAAITLLTTYHAVNVPEVMVESFGPAEGPAGRQPPERPIQSIAIRMRQTNAIVGPSQFDTFEILAHDAADDLALIGVRREVDRSGDFAPLSPAGAPEIPRLDFAVGDPRRLSWGSFVYVLGHPGGFRMVTRGIVSEPNRNEDGAFLVDGLWNEGMSGAPIIAIRGESGAFEWIGIARAAAARTTYRLGPLEGAERTQDLKRPYEGPVYLQSVQEIRPGISFSTPLTAARRFIERSRPELASLGYPLP